MVRHMEAINVIKINSYSQLSALMHDVADSGFTACCVLSCDKSFKLLNELATYKDKIHLGGIHLETFDFSGYDREYYFSLDGDMQLYIEPAMHEGCTKYPDGYIYNEADIYFIDGDSRATILELYQNLICFEVDIED